VKRARNLCPENVASLFGNLQLFYSTHSYLPDHIWNCDEAGAQASRNGGGTLVFAKKGCRSVHSIIPDQREWLSILSCVNAAGGYIQHFYIFKGRCIRQNYIARCEVGATMAMQAKAWMTGFLFSSWIAHFVKALENRGGIFPTNRHLLILDGHNSHVTLDVVYKAKQNGLDLLTLPSHTSHRLQPLDCSVFQPFKCAFRGYRDAWTLQNRGRAAQKEDLAEWVSLALERALTPRNIMQGFKGIGIWPLNHEAVVGKMGPFEQFHNISLPGLEDMEDDQRHPAFYKGLVDSDNECSDDCEENRGHVQGRFDLNGGAGGSEGPDAGQYVLLQASPAASEQYYVGEAGCSGELSANSTMLAACVGLGAEASTNCAQVPSSISQFLQLPETLVNPVKRSKTEPLVDYTKSTIMTGDEYIKTMEEKVARKESIEKEKELKKKEAELTKGRRLEEKFRRRWQDINDCRI
jgi:hypothetical protein